MKAWKEKKKRMRENTAENTNKQNSSSSTPSVSWRMCIRKFCFPPVLYSFLAHFFVFISSPLRILMQIYPIIDFLFLSYHICIYVYIYIGWGKSRKKNSLYALDHLKWTHLVINRFIYHATGN
uniref:Uncharacterized protein n=1 Tax=Trypanosoma congolense (strain IL3000) TaxID=1068625 RepID=G0V1W0_TRYCI|nr:hypothetical protein, unlikely [Trypanosoma congolense IL3000]